MNSTQINPRRWRTALSACTLLMITACGGGQMSTVQGKLNTENLENTVQEKMPIKTTIKDAYAPYFPVGVAVAPHHLENVSDVIKQHFNHLTAENDMKFGPTHPEMEKWDFANADLIAQFARDNQMKMTGHALIWHRMQPDWLFADLKPGEKESIEKLRARLKAHIDTIVPRYSDVIDNWDVVNEAISDTPEKQYRDGGEDSKWFEIYGDETYILDAFKFAQEALEKSIGSAEGQLYYNDYNTPQKVDKILKMAKWLRDENQIPVAGIGFQAHWNIDGPSIEEIETAVNKIVEAGFKIKFSELDLSIYSKDDWTNKKWEEEKPFSAELQAKQANRYKALFELFRKHKEHITSVTFWGVSDEATWLDSFPVENRNNHPLLFDDNHKPKASVPAILSFQ